MKKFKITTNKLALFGVALTLFTAASCKKNSEPFDDLGTGPDQTLYALTADNKLMTFKANNPSGGTAAALTNLAAGETIVGIDYRPATGELYGVSSNSGIYVINPQTGAVRSVGPAFTPTIGSTTVGFDFNPTVDRIRLVTSTGQNLRIHPETGAVAFVDGNINGPITTGLSAAAYTNNKAGQTSTTLYVLDAGTDKLYKQDPPNNGTLVAVGDLGINADQIGGFDIGSNGLTLATIKSGGATALYSIDLTTGKALRLRNNFQSDIIGLAIPTEPVAYTINNENKLVVFNPATGIAATPKDISGLQAGETILGIDIRPATGQLYALGSSSRLYVLNPAGGAVAPVGAVPFTALLSGTDFGFDFNPFADRVRIVSNTGQNLRVNPADGVALVDGVLTGTNPAITAAAYTNNVAGAASTVLYDIDTQNNRLVKQDPPNNGTLVDVGALGVTATSANGFDIGGKSGIAYALLTVGGTTKVYTINLTTGAATAGATLVSDKAYTYKGFALGLGF